MPHDTRFAFVALVLMLAASGAPAGEEETFDYFANNWNVVGLRDYLHGSRISPANELWLAGRTAIQVRVGRELSPLCRAHGKQALEGWLPVISTTAHDGPVRYDISFWATPLPDAKDWASAFNWPTEGENYLNWISVKATNTSQDPAEAKAEVGPNAAIKIPRHPEEQAEQKTPGSHVRRFAWTWTLKPGESAEGVARYPYFPVDDPARYDNADAAAWLARTVDYWRGTMDRAARIDVPCRKATSALKAAHVCQLIANDHGEVHGGEGFYDVFYIRDGAYQVMELEEAGFLDTAAKAVELYLKRQRPDGRFESQAGQFDANGQAVWTLWQYAKITGDRAFLERVYAQMLRAARWTEQARRQTPADSPYVGLLPAAPADGECLWDGKHHIVGYDIWNLRGLLCTADAARTLGKIDEEKQLREEAEAYRAAIDAAVRQLKTAHFPPAWEKAGTHWGNTETLWPTELFGRNDPRIAAQIDHVRKEFGGGFIEGTIQWRGNGDGVIHPYMGAYTTMNDLVRGRHEQVVEDFYWYLLHSTAANAFPEGIFFRSRVAWSETIPHVTGACNYAIMLRHMLVHEASDELHLLSAVPDGWLDDGREIRVERLPTHFGPMDLAVRGAAAGVEVKLTAPTRQPPKRIVLHLPSDRPLTKAVAGVAAATRERQTVKWDFPTVVGRYRASQHYQTTLTTGKPVSCSSSLPSHPAETANDGVSNSTDAYWATDVEKMHDPAPWWQVDLGPSTVVGRVVVVCYYGDARSYGFFVEGSLDGKRWDMLADRRDNKAPAIQAGYVSTFEPRPVRYLRVTQTANSANSGRHLVEVMAFEK